MTPEQQSRADEHSAYAWDRYLAGQPQEARLKLTVAHYSRLQAQAVRNSPEGIQAAQRAYEAQKALLAYWAQKRAAAGLANR